jgi:hypothetical protein
VKLGEEHYPAWGEADPQCAHWPQSLSTKPLASRCGSSSQSIRTNAQIFNDSMSGMTAQAESALHAAYDFAGINTIVDVGGGHGGLITSILTRYPNMRGILFDAPVVIEGAKPNIAASTIAERCEVIGGDFFQSVPSGGDAIIMKWIIHDWNDEQSVSIMKNCRRALPIMED